MRRLISLFLSMLALFISLESVGWGLPMGFIRNDDPVPGVILGKQSWRNCAGSLEQKRALDPFSEEVPTPSSAFADPQLEHDDHSIHRQLSKLQSFQDFLESSFVSFIRGTTLLQSRHLVVLRSMESGRSRMTIQATAVPGIYGVGWDLVLPALDLDAPWTDALRQFAAERGWRVWMDLVAWVHDAESGARFVEKIAVRNFDDQTWEPITPEKSAPGKRGRPFVELFVAWGESRP